MSERMQKLEQWLDSHTARLMWSQAVPDVGKVDCYFVLGQIVLVMRYVRDGDARGWDLFLQPASGLNSEKTLVSATQTLQKRLAEMQLEGLVT